MNSSTKSSIEREVELTTNSNRGRDLFTNAYPPWIFVNGRGTYGGTTTAQCLVAAQHTVSSPLLAYSLHVNFLSAGNPELPTEYTVERMRDGKNFATRIVRACQDGRIIATATVNFASGAGATGRNGGVAAARFEHAKTMPILLTLPDEAKVEVDGPLELRKGEALNKQSDNATEKRILYWMRAKGPIRENEKLLETQLAALAYLSDAYLLAAITEVGNDPDWETVEMAASLVHTVHFHEPKAVRADQWMCSERESPWAGNDRGLVLHRIWSNEGVLVATCLQEGLVRPKTKMRL